MKSIDRTGSTETGTVNRSGACRSNHLRGVMRRLSSSSLSIVMFGVENPKHMQVVQGVGRCAGNCSIRRQSQEQPLCHCNINCAISSYQMPDACYSQIPQRIWAIEVKNNTRQPR